MNRRFLSWRSRPLTLLAVGGAILLGCTTDVAQPASTTPATTTTASLSAPLAGVRVLGVPQPIGPQHIGISGPSPCPSAPPFPGSSENRFWVPDGPPHAYTDAQGQTRLLIPHVRTFPFVGPDLDHVALNCGDMISESAQNPDPNAYDDTSWPQAPYRLPDGRTFAINHHEYHEWSHGYPNRGSWYAALTLSQAADGVHFARVAGDHTIARPTRPFGNDGSLLGYSDPTNILRNPVDGAYYLVAMRRDPTTRDCVLRSTDISNVTSFRTWNGSSYSGTPSTGGDCVDFTAQHGDFAPGSLSYSTYLGTAVYLAYGQDKAGRQGFWAFYDVSSGHDLSAWSAPALVLEVPMPWGLNPSTPGRKTWSYPSLIDPAGGPNYDRIGQTPYLYFNSGGLNPERNVNRVPVRFERGSGDIRNRGEGFYRVGGGAYYSNGFNQYCAISSMGQLIGMGFTQPFDHLNPYGDHGAMSYAGVCGAPPRRPRVPHDFDGDGRSDLYIHGRPGVGAVDYMATAAVAGNGFNFWTWHGGENWFWGNSFEPVIGDFNGDGKADLYLHGRPGSGVSDYMGTSNGSGFNFWTWHAPDTWVWGDAFDVFTADFNGDGKDDLYLHGRANSGAIDYMATANDAGNGFNFWTWQGGSNWLWGNSYDVTFGDFNGDGKADLYLHAKPGSNQADYMGTSNGSGFNFWTWQAPAVWNWGNTFDIFTADFDGDGKSDLYLHAKPGTNQPDYMGLATGDGFALWTWSTSANWGWGNIFDVKFGDFNGDGKADLYLHAKPGTNQPDYMGLSTGTGFSYWTWTANYNWGNVFEITLGDYNADGKTDLYLHGRPNSGASDAVAVSDGQQFIPVWQAPPTWLWGNTFEVAR